MPAIKATDVTYHSLIMQPGWTLVMYDDTRYNYGNCVKLRAAFRAQASDQMMAVLFDARTMTVDPGRLTYLPTFRMYRDGICIEEWDTIGVTQLRLFAWAILGPLHNLGKIAASRIVSDWST